MANIFKKIASHYKFTKSKLSFGEKVALALPGPASVIGPIIIHNAMIKFYTDIIGIDPKYVGWIYIIYNIWNAINDPLLGAWVDRMKYNEKRGKYVYLMKVTVPFMLLSTLGMFLTSPAWSDMVVFFVFLAELFIFDTAYTVYSVAYQSYFLIAAPTKEERVDVDIIRTFLGNVVGAVTTIIPTLLMVGNGKRSLVIPALSAVVAMNAVIYLIAFRTLKDKGELYANEVHEEQKPFRETVREAWAIIKQPAFLTYLLFYITARGAMEYYYTPFLYFMDDVLESSGLMATIADTIPGLFMLALIPVFGNNIKKYGSKTMSIFSLVPAAIGFGGLLFITEAWQAVICYCFIVLALNICQRAGVVLNGDLIDDDERRTGIRKTGLYGGVFSLLATSLTGLQQLVFTNVISAYSYNGALEVQTAEAVTGIRIGAGLVPLIMCVVGLIPMLFFPIGRKKEQELSEFMDSRRSLSGSSATKVIKTNGRSFITADGKQVTLQGVNMVCKDRALNHIGPYDDDAFALLASLKMNVVRLGIFWESVEPEPGIYDDAYLAEIDTIVARAKKHGICVYLDMHQDLFSSMFEDGAPEWATITDGKDHVRNALWSESYLLSGAVQAAFDNFWANTAAKDGVGLQDHFINAWTHIAAHYADEPYVIGYDFFNEPFPGSSVTQILPVIAAIDEKLNSGTACEADLFEAISGIETVSGAFEELQLNPFYEKIVRAVRKADPECLVFFETSYFCNAAVPSHIKLVSADDGSILKNQVYAPHGYDIFVDTENYDNPDTSRVDLIFGTHAQTAEKLGLPLLIGEWGCYPHATENQLSQARHLKELFKALGASDTYFDYSQLSGNRIVEIWK
ncbi:MAG: MFS transporter [Treponema sp.]|nr:MFS transporter [Candidatus Treponema caballi]